MGALELLREARRAMTREPMYAGDYVRFLHKRFGSMREISPPMEVWVASSFARPEKVKVIRIRGELDREYSGFSYVDTEDGRSLSSHYIFPVKGYKRPEKLRFSDEYGFKTDWASVPRRWKAEDYERQGFERP